MSILYYFLSFILFIPQFYTRERPQTTGRDKQKPCFIEGCRANVVNIPRHLRQVHMMNKQQIKNILQKKKTRKRVYPISICPTCSFAGTRIDRHLEKKHKMDHLTALLMAKTARKKHTDTQKTKTKSNLTATDHANLFIEHFNSLEGGHYIDPELPKKRFQKKEQLHQRMKTMVEKMLTLTFGSDTIIPFESLYILKNIGRKQGEKDSVLNQLKVGNSWGTVRNYLNALGHFYLYLKARDIDDLTKAQIESMIESQKGLHKSIWNLSRDELQRKKIEDSERLIPIDFINTFFKQNYIEEILQNKIPTDISNSEQTRNFILLHLAYTNCKRTGIFEALTLEHIKTAKTVTEGVIILIQDGKTFSQSGAAGIFMTHEEFRALKNYIALSRPAFNPVTNQVFCRTDGGDSTTQEMCRYAQRA